MALDSSGNIAVDYVWGNFPLQPDTERGNEAVVTYQVTEADEKSGFQRFTLWASVAPAVGDEFTFEVTPGFIPLNAGGSTDGLAGKYTVLSTEPYPTVGQWYVKTTSPYINTAYGALATPVGSAVVDPAKNIGGGAGDKNWSKTTQKKSAVLDPTLDGHNITTEFWNNFPGYTPNAGFVPQQVWAGTVIGGITERPYFQYEEGYDNPDMYGNQRPQGYSIRIATGALSTEDFAALQDAITSHALIGQRVPAINGVDYYNNLIVAPSGYIVGSDVSVDAYGNTTGASIQVQVDNFSSTPWYNLMGFIPTGSTLSFGIGDPKTVVLDAKVGVDFGAITLYNQVYGGYPHWDIEANSSTPLSDALKNALLDTNNYPAYIGVAEIQEQDSGQLVDRKYNFTKITGADLVTGMYGQQVVRVYADAISTNNTWYVANLPAWWDYSLSIAVIK